MEVNVIGAGLAGCEAAFLLANRGVQVKLFEMRPKQSSAAHKTDLFAELVCSNSLRSNTLKNAVGILKAEMAMFNSLVIKAANKSSVPAGSALAVDRLNFATYITEVLKQHENITIVNEEVTKIDLDSYTIIATGPLTSDDFSSYIKDIFGEDYFYFYDAAAPIIEADSINYDIAYFKDRYDDDNVGAYLNCPMNEAQFDDWYEQLLNAEVVEFKEFEKEIYFNGCMPFEEMARKGKQTLLYGPMKPVGLRQGAQKHHAVVQLRQDNVSKSLYNIVGFQTHLKWNEQKRLLQMIPGLEACEIVRYGVMHRNTFINSPKLLNYAYQAKQYPKVFFAGQITGVEGYVESAASGILSAINLFSYMQTKQLVKFPTTTVMGSMAHYVSHCNSTDFQPMNANFGLLDNLTFEHKKRERKDLYAKRALDRMKEFINANNLM